MWNITFGLLLLPIDRHTCMYASNLVSMFSKVKRKGCGEIAFYCGVLA